MTAKKDKPVLPKEKVPHPRDAPELAGKWNWRLSEGEWVGEMLDEKGLPLPEPVLPKKKKKDK
jgi:hypothetical protein